MSNERALFLLDLLSEVAGAAFRAADDSEERDEEGSRIHVVGFGDFDALSKSLDACDELPELDDAYVRDGWLRAVDELRAILEAPKAEPVLVEAVAVTREGDDGLYLDWLVEGGICALEAPGTLLLVAQGELTNDSGNGYVHPARNPEDDE